MYSKEHTEESSKEFSQKYFLQKAQKYCSMQERSAFQAKNKLSEWGALPDTINHVLDSLYKEGFLNDDRYIALFIRSKLRQNKWGRIKISIELKKQKFLQEQINSCLTIIDDTEYRHILSDLILKKQVTLKNEKDALKRKQKIVYFCMSKGFESELIYSLLH